MFCADLQVLNVHKNRRIVRKSTIINVALQVLRVAVRDSIVNNNRRLILCLVEEVQFVAAR